MLLWVYISPLLNFSSLVPGAYELDIPGLPVVPGGAVLNAQDFGPRIPEPETREVPGMEADSSGDPNTVVIPLCIKEEAQDFGVGALVLVDPSNMRTDAPSALPMDVVGIIFSGLELADLHQMAGVSKAFYTLAHRIIDRSFRINLGGRVFWDYSRILKVFVAAVHAARETGGQAGVLIVPGGFSQLQCARHILENEFGYCIQHVMGEQVFGWRELFARTLCNERQISIMPQILDQFAVNYDFLQLIRMLSDSGRLDLLCQLTFPRINTACFCDLMSSMVPESVVEAAARSLQQNEPESELSSLLSLVGLGDESVLLPSDCKIPLFLVPYLYEKRARIPRDCTFFCQQEPDSVRFWMYMLGKDAEEGRRLVDYVLEHEGEQSIRLAHVFREQVSTVNLPRKMEDAYYAMLIRFHSSCHRNEHVERNYAAMLNSSPTFGYHCAHALFDCEEYELLDKCNPSYQEDFASKALIDRMLYSEDAGANLLLEVVVKRYSDAARLLKGLIVSQADDARVMLLWRLMQKKGYSSIEDHCCSASLEVLKYLALEQNPSCEAIGEMLGALEGVERNVKDVSREALVLYTVLFWEAPERIVDYFVDLVPGDHRIDGEFVWKFLLKKEYSRELCAKLLGRLEIQEYKYCTPLRSFRPDLAGVFSDLDGKWKL